MVSPLNQILETLQDPNTRHAALVHLPIALSVLGVLAAILALALGRRQTMRWTAVGVYALLAGSAWLAVQSGEDAHGTWSKQLATGAYEIVEVHEERAEWVWIFALGVAALLGLTAVPHRKLRPILGVAGVLGALFVAGWVGYIGHLGGRMVYEFGAGTPQPLLAEADAEDGAGGDAEEFDDPRAAFFHAEVLPILQTNCIRCHNPGGKRIPAGLNQTSIADILEGGIGGPAVVPGRPEESLLYQAAAHEIEDLEMPPDEDRLSDEDLEKLARWIRDGAVWGTPSDEATKRRSDEGGESDQT